MQVFKTTIFKAAVLGLLVGASSSAFAETLTRDQVKEQAIDICQAEAKARYGENAVKSVGKKAKWKKGLDGAQVKMKIKPEKKKAGKYSCVVSIDKKVTFFRG